MKKAFVMYAVIVITGTVGMLMPVFFLRWHEKHISDERYYFQSKQSEMLVVDEPSPTHDYHTADIVSAKRESQLYNRLSLLQATFYPTEYMRLISYKNMFEIEATKTLMDKLYKALEALDEIAGTSIISSGSDSAEENQIITHSYEGIYVDKKLEFYRVHIMYDANNGLHGSNAEQRLETSPYLEICFDAHTFDIYSVKGELYTEYEPWELLKNYSEQLGLSEKHYENYNQTLSNQSLHQTDGAFSVEIYNYEKDFSLTISLSGYIPEPYVTAVPTELPAPTEAVKTENE